LNDSNSLLNGPSLIPTRVADSSKVLEDKTSPSLSNYLVRNALLILSLFFLYHGATNALSLSLSHWALFLQPFLRHRTPNRLVPLPFPKTPHRQASLPFTYPDTYLLTSSYMLLMLFVSLLLGMARLNGLVLVASLLTEQQAPVGAPSDGAQPP
jgi:hypothetical protein